MENVKIVERNAWLVTAKLANLNLDLGTILLSPQLLTKSCAPRVNRSKQQLGLLWNRVSAMISAMFAFTPTSAQQNPHGQ
jgi:hypothetical protein